MDIGEKRMDLVKSESEFNRRSVALGYMRDWLSRNTLDDVAEIDRTTLRVERFRNCEIQLRQSAQRGCWVFLIYAYGKAGVRDWAMNVVDMLDGHLTGGLNAERGNPDKAGDGSRVVVKFRSEVDICDYDGGKVLLPIYVGLRAELLEKGILERVQKRESSVVYVPNANEIRHVLDNLPTAIKTAANRFNVFDVLGVARMEIRHSNVLAWLLDESAEHGMGAEIVRALLKRAGASELARAVDAHSFTVRREWNHIDLFLKSEKEKMVIVIENKIGAEEGVQDGESQLRRYSDRIDKFFRDWNLTQTGRKILIFLTPDGLPPTDGNEEWCPVTYANLIADIEKVYERKKDQLTPDVSGLIEQYIDTIKRRVLMKVDPQLQAECRRFYIENKKVLDFVIEYGKMGLKDEVEEVLASFASNGKILHDAEQDGRLEFRIAALDELLVRKDGKNEHRAYRCFVEGVRPDSGHVCVVMELRLTENGDLNERVMEFRESFTGEKWGENKLGEMKAFMNLPWPGKNGKTGERNWKAFSLADGDRPLSSAVEAAVDEFLEKGVPKILSHAQVMEA